MGDYVALRRLALCLEYCHCHPSKVDLSLSALIEIDAYDRIKEEMRDDG